LQCLFFSVILVKFLIEDGKSHWMSGLTLVGEYTCRQSVQPDSNPTHRNIHHDIRDLLVLSNVFDGGAGGQLDPFLLHELATLVGL
jgi:hypothetical protein